MAGSIGLGSSAALTNPSCSVTQPTLVTSGNQATLAMQVTFNGTSSGTQPISALASDVSGLSSGWVGQGSAVVALPPDTPAITTVPGVVVNPVGTPQTMTYGFYDPNGADHISNVQGGSSDCLTTYQGGVFSLNNAAGTLPPGSGGSLSNSYCTLSSPTISLSGTQMTMAGVITPSDLAKGSSPQLWAGVQDVSGSQVVWIPVGVATTPDPGVQPLQFTISPATQTLHVNRPTEGDSKTLEIDVNVTGTACGNTICTVRVDSLVSASQESTGISETASDTVTISQLNHVYTAKLFHTISGGVRPGDSNTNTNPYQVSITATGSPGNAKQFATASIRIDPPLPDFTIDDVTGPTPAYISPGAAATYTIKVTGHDGFYNTVGFSCNSGDLPSGAVCIFVPSTVTLGSAQQTVNLTLTTTNSTPLRPYGATFTITASGGGKSPTKGAVIVIVGQQDFSIASEATSPQPIAPGGVATFKVSVYPGIGFSGPVSLSASSVPANASVGFSAPTLYPGGLATMTVTTNSSIAPNQYVIMISGTSAGTSRSTGASLLVSVATPASMISPAPGALLTAGTRTFKWSAGTGVSQYQLLVGSTPGASNYFSSTGSSLSATVSLANATGPAVYATLKSLISGVWQPQSYTYSLFSGTVTTAANSATPARSDKYYVLNDGVPKTWDYRLNNGADARWIDATSLKTSCAAVTPTLAEFDGSDVSVHNVKWVATSSAVPGQCDLSLNWSAPIPPFACPVPLDSNGYCTITLRLADAVDVYDATPHITAVTQYPPEQLGGPFYITVWGSNFGPSQGTLTICRHQDDQCSNTLDFVGEPKITYWSDDRGQGFSQINAILTPAPDAVGDYDVQITSKGANGHNFAPAPQPPSQSQSNRGGPVSVIRVNIRRQSDNEDITNSTQTVIVGQQIALVATVAPSLVNVSGRKWNIGGKYVGGFHTEALADTQLTKAYTTDPDLTGSGVSFYFTDSAAALAITFDATIGGASYHAKTTFNVVKPESSGIEIGPRDISAIKLTPNGFVELNPAMSFTVNAFSVPPSFSGSQQWVQVVDNHRTVRTPRDGSTPQVRSCSGRLDTNYPYSSDAVHTSDSPNNELLAAYQEYTYSTSFTMYYMFRPDLPNAIFVPLQKVTWQWGWDVVSDVGGSWTFISRTPPGAPTSTATNSFPAWTGNITGCTYQ